MGERQTDRDKDRQTETERVCVRVREREREGLPCSQSPCKTTPLIEWRNTKAESHFWMTGRNKVYTVTSLSCQSNNLGQVSVLTVASLLPSVVVTLNKNLFKTK